MIQNKCKTREWEATACPNEARIPQGKNKVRWAAKRQKKKVSELRQAGENKPRKCGRSQVAY